MPWLDDVEQRAWRGLLDTHARLLDVLDEDLRQSTGLSLAEYEVLVLLSEAPGGRLRMSDLARRVNLSPSGLTRRLDRLVASGAVARQACGEDRRGSFAVLTTAGARRLAGAAPDHVSQVRRHFLDRLDRHQIATLADAFEAVTSGLTR